MSLTQCPAALRSTSNIQLQILCSLLWTVALSWWALLLPVCLETGVGGQFNSRVGLRECIYSKHTVWRCERLLIKHSCCSAQHCYTLHICVCVCSLPKRPPFPLWRGVSWRQTGSGLESFERMWEGLVTSDRRRENRETVTVTSDPMVWTLEDLDTELDQIWSWCGCLRTQAR